MDAAKDEFIYVRKLDEENYFDDILRFNLNNKHLWLPYYPHHENWIKTVIKELKSDNYSRIVFGGFYRVGETQNRYKFCCSVIVKKNQFANFLEIKNLIVFAVKHAENQEQLQRIYQNRLIGFIKEFAQKRGYSKLVTELSKKKDKALINIFLENDFIITGSQSERYNQSDEIVFLSYEVNQLYGYDPYDNFSSSFWILKKYLKCQRLHQVEGKVSVKNKEKKGLQAPAYYFYNGRVRTSLPESKFNAKNLLIILGENFGTANSHSDIAGIEIAIPEISKIYLFDFTKEKFSRKLPDYEKDRLTIFERDELQELMGYTDYNLVKRRRFDYTDVGGLLLISNPKRFPFAKANDLLDKQNKPFIYLKLGDYGRYVDDTMPIVFAYYPENSERNTLEIWAIAKLNALPLTLDINAIKEQNNSPENQPVNKSTYLDAEFLFEELAEQISDSDDNKFQETILWSPHEFNKHNRYNETKLVIAFSIEKFYNLKENHQQLQLETILETPGYFDDIENVFDFYLSKKEAEIIQQKAGINLDESTNKDTINHSEFEFLYVHAMADDTLRLNSDHDEIIKIISDTKRIKLRNAIIEASYSKLLAECEIKYPNIIHFSGHGDHEGLKLQNDKMSRAEILTNDELHHLFKDPQNNLGLVVLNSCFSEIQAKIISEFGIYVVGFTAEVSPNTGKEFSKRFYEGFTKKISSGLKTAIDVGCANFAKIYPEFKNLISVWKDGQEIFLSKTKKINETEHN
jgi:hypothetical protein